MKLFLNGEYCSSSRANTSAFDRGFVFGDGIFTTIKVEHSHPLLLSRHLRRLQDSCAFLAITYPACDFGEIIETLLFKNKLDNARVKIIITRGVDRENRIFTYPADQPSVAVFATPLAPARTAVSLITLEGFRGNDPLYHHKTISYVQNLYYKTRCRHHGADDGIITDYQGRVCETTTANLFFVRDEAIITPPSRLPLLNGVMRQELLARGKVGTFSILEDIVTKDDLIAVEAAFITSAIEEICPVSRINDRFLPVAVPAMVQRLWFRQRNG